MSFLSRVGKWNRNEGCQKEMREGKQRWMGSGREKESMDAEGDQHG